MPFFFSKFPKIEYKLSSGQTVTAVDITKRFRFVQSNLKAKLVYYTYDLKESDTPLSVAKKYYGDASLDWFIYMTNQMYDPYFDWPLTSREFRAYIRDKYGSTQEASQEPHEYYRIIKFKEVLTDGTIIDEKKILVDNLEYQTLADFERSEINKYKWEEQLNENKRTIKLIDKSYLPIIIAEFNKTFE